MLGSHKWFRHSAPLQYFLFIGLYGGLLFLFLDCEYPGILFIVQLSLFVCRRSLLVSLGWRADLMPQAIRVIPASRFGNHVIELAHALHYCALIRVRIVYVDRDFLCINKTVNTTAGVTICMDKQPSGQRVLAGVFYNLRKPTGCAPLNYRTIIATFRCLVLENMPHLLQSPTALFVYIRGGDIFIPPVNRYYGQPPCGYYTEAIEMDDAVEIHVISEDMKNPCLALVLEQTGGHWKPRTMMTDIAELIYSKRMIMARGTFSLAA
jgi:hypothetical protein